jgi:integrase
MKVEMNKIIKQPPRWLSKKELDVLCKHTKDPVLSDLFRFAVHSGCRLSECVNVRWHFVDFNNRCFTIAPQYNFATKNGKSRTIPMDNVVFEILNNQLKNRYKNTTYVFQKGGFPLKKSYVTHKFREFCDDAKLPKQYHFHTLRHTAISWWLMSGISAFTVKEYAGHSDTSLIDNIYGHLSADHKQDEMEKLNAWMKKSN